MATENELTCTPVDKKEMKREDLLQLMNVYSSEFNNSSMHDRVLVFEVAQGDSEEYDVLGEEDDEGEERNGAKEKDETVEDTEETVEVQDETVEAKDETVEEKEDKDEAVRKEEERKEGEKIKEKEKEGEQRKGAEAQETIRDAYEGENVEKNEETLNAHEEMIEEKVESDESEDVLLENSSETKDEGGTACEETSSDKQPNIHKLFVHSSWLSVQSSYFRALFYSGMKESNCKEVVMKIDESELQPHLTLIEAMYKLDILNDKDYSLVLEVLVLAHKYDVNLVFKKCKYVLMDTPLTLEICEVILERMEDLPESEWYDLLEVLTKFLVKEFSPLDKTWTMDKFIDLSEASLRLILSSDDLAVQSENTVFVALMRWVGSVGKGRLLQLLSFQQSSLLRLVRFELMSVDFLYDVVRKHSTATKMAGFGKRLQKGLGYHCFSKERVGELEDKPIKRSSFQDEGPTFSWVIDCNVRKKLLHSGQAVRSNHFWYQGYEMVVKLSYEAESNSFGVYLIVQDILHKGCLKLSWTAKSNLFESKSFTVRKMYSKGTSWGRPKVKSSNSSLSLLPDDLSHTIDVWVMAFT